MGTAAKYVFEFTFLGISTINNDNVTDHNIFKAARDIYHKANKVMDDFKSEKSFSVAWRRTIKKICAMPKTTHCKYLHTINNSLPIERVHGKRCLKLICYCINSNITTVKSVSSSAI